MSDLMFYGVLHMPYEMAMNDIMSSWQFYSKAREAADRVERLETENAELRAARVGWKWVPISASNEIICAIEAMVDQQLIASGSSPADMIRQDGGDIWDAAIAAAPAAPGDGDYPNTEV